VPSLNGNQQITISGSSFAAGATVTYYDPSSVAYTAKAATVSSSTQIVDTAFNDTADPGTWHVVVTNPGASASNSYPFTVLSPAATVNGVSPSPVPSLNGNQQITISGSSFAAGATVTYYDPSSVAYTAKAATVSSSTQIVDTAFNDTADPGTWHVVVTNPGASASNSYPFTVLTPAATVNGVSPSPVPSLNGNQQITISGSSFAAGATVTYYDPSNAAYPAKAATVSSSTQIVDTQFNDTADPGTWHVVVTNPGASASNSYPFTVK
jgi:UDP-N-acetylmuramoylalanine-D-glutamate ligase